MKLLIVFIVVCMCVSASFEIDLDAVLRRLKDAENKANRYEVAIATLQSQVERQEQTIADLQKNNGHAIMSLEDITGKLKSLEHVSGIDVLRQKRFVVDPEIPVAFHAVITGAEHPHFGPDQRIVFDSQLLNIGGGYDRLKGEFTAPYSGVYVFSLSVMSFNANNHVEVAATIMTNGNATARAYAHADSGRWDQGSVTVTTQLEAGDQVYVENYVLTDVSLYGDSYSSFTGYLLVPM